MDKYERIAKEISKIRELESQIKQSEGIDLNIKYISHSRITPSRQKLERQR